LYWKKKRGKITRKMKETPPREKLILWPDKSAKMTK